MLQQLKSNPAAGSPPQVRGKPPEDEIERVYIRITPAGAGKTRFDRLVEIQYGDHPRRCGENVLPERTEPSNRGSPPQVRGKLVILKL